MELTRDDHETCIQNDMKMFSYIKFNFVQNEKCFETFFKSSILTIDFELLVKKTTQRPLYHFHVFSTTSLAKMATPSVSV